jgi:hypothetical protein
MRAEGMTLQAIADRLNAEGVPTLGGGAMWRPSSVHYAAGYRRPRRSDPPPRTPDRGGSDGDEPVAGDPAGPERRLPR